MNDIWQRRTFESRRRRSGAKPGPDDGCDWSDLDQNPANRSVRLARVERELVATCGACRFMFFVNVLRHPHPDGMAKTNIRIADARIERGSTHRGCGGQIRFWR